MLSPIAKTIFLLAATIFLASAPGARSQNFGAGGGINPLGQSINLGVGGSASYLDVNLINEREGSVDRRVSDGWVNMYPFGELFYDREVLDQPNHDTQIDLDFYFPFYGFRFNYTFIVPDGILAFSRPEWIQPPYTFPNPRWPDPRNGRDPSFVAPLYADATYQYVGEVRISHLWYRSVHRPRFGTRQGPNAGVPSNPFGGPSPFDATNPNFANQLQQYGNVRRQSGYVEDDYLLDNITRDIQEGIVGANGFRANHALIVTWERMAYGGAPKSVDISQYEQIRQWQNTYQVVLASDEIRSYVIFNYGTLNWTASSEAGALYGRGGRQAAIVGFNGGNGTGFTGMPYSGEGDLYKLAAYASSDVPGRWIYRVDEEITQGGCNNRSLGKMTVSPTYSTMLGGQAVNISGPCIRPGDQVVAIFDQGAINCETINTGRARCILPPFRRVGMVPMKFSRDGGESWPYIGNFYVVQPDLADPKVQLVRDVVTPENNFENPYADQLKIRWAPLNLTADANARIDIEIFGYWEDLETNELVRVGVLAEAQSNSGLYEFRPSTLVRTSTKLDPNAEYWRRFSFGVIRVSHVVDNVGGNFVSDEINRGNVFYSKLMPLAWYFLKDWQYEYGDNWALDKCIEWFDYDGRRNNFHMDLEPCPCVLDQAVIDIGRYMPYPECNMYSNSECPHHRGAKHCVMSTQSTWMGSQQVCCYGYQGWLMMSDDYEFYSDQLNAFSPGTPFRSSILGAYPYRVPPFVPSMSNYFNDLMPYQLCCKYAKHCEFYFWRRQSSACQDYRPPGAGFAYGEPHFVTFDGIRYTFNGKGYFVLAMANHPWHKLMIQVRMEQPPETLWGVYPNATVITGVAVQENDSDVVQVLARKQFRRWRYKTDVLVDGVKRFFDRPAWKYQVFTGLSLYNPERNMNQSEIHIQLKSGAGVRITEAYGSLQVEVLLPPSFNRTYRGPGLPPDEFVTLDSGTPVIQPQSNNIVMNTESELRSLHFRFGNEWMVDGSDPRIGPVLFQSDLKPIYNPLLFSEPAVTWQPRFEIDNPLSGNQSRYTSLIFSSQQVTDTCQNNWACRYDYLNTGIRELALNTLEVENKFLEKKRRGTIQYTSCGALYKGPGVIKFPIGNNYLEGVTVTFSCQPDYFLHGDQQRTCRNGTWTPGWYVWCRTRSLEYFLKWMTGLLTSAAILVIIVFIFFACYWQNVRPRQDEAKMGGGAFGAQAPPPPAATQSAGRPGFSPGAGFVPRPPSYQPELTKAALAKDGGSRTDISEAAHSTHTPVPKVVGHPFAMTTSA